MLQFHPLTIAAVEPETEEAVRVTFDVPADLADAYRFVQGQHLTLRTDLDGEDVRRTYSICAGTDEGRLQVAIKKVDGGRFSTWANAALKPGDVLQVLEPTGRFHTVLEPEAQRTYVAFAAGSGITPILSIIRSTLATEPHSRFTLFYGNRTTAGVMFREALEDLKNRFMGRLSLFYLFSREPQDTELFNGRLDAGKARAFCRGLINPQAVDAFFLCGPGGMIEEVKTVLAEAGVPDERIHAELFLTGPAAPPPRRTERPAPAGGTDVTVWLDGRATRFDLSDPDATLLDAALAEGMDLPFACKGGVCCTCRAHLREGEVEMAANYSLEPHEVEEGFILTCQARALSKTVVVDFDKV
ncbi:1,2-phenylacetyl-CoA epoxidase subunit PaaE [Marinibaculum pumilum]|uniref:1,2-phenylacetyl-CoA epoxidase subunit PaaE n=1 Tax=Marinibaculum pumilum TaxID=1766165 RepID=A0ABV7L8D0_9PROT